jgi:hypothetical protein
MTNLIIESVRSATVSQFAILELAIAIEGESIDTLSTQ